tara:strand:+ start:6702 stop:7235 length:534 start_codon:yes stop_codon:yes gene_type:complete
MTDSYEKALTLATWAHADQKRKDDQDYITHPVAVADRFKDESHKCASVLHDTWEDCRDKIKDAKLYYEYEMSSDVTKAIFIVSKKWEVRENYFDFIMRIVDGSSVDYTEYDLMALRVKLADLEHNMSDLNEGSMKDKYRFARQMIIESLDSNTLPDKEMKIWKGEFSYHKQFQGENK